MVKLNPSKDREPKSKFYSLIHLGSEEYRLHKSKNRHTLQCTMHNGLGNYDIPNRHSLGNFILKNSFLYLILVTIVLINTSTIKDLHNEYLKTLNFTIVQALKCYYDENRIFPIKAILKHKQVACKRRKKLLPIFKYLFLFQRYSSF